MRATRRARSARHVVVPGVPVARMAGSYAVRPSPKIPRIVANPPPRREIFWPLA